MDEPFAALDPQIRHSLRIKFRTWVERLGTTVLFVSHDVEEALVLGDRLGVMATGGHLGSGGYSARRPAAPINDQVRAFLGADRTLKPLPVTPIDTDDPTQIMAPQYNPLFPRANYQTGDIAGLQALAGTSCPRPGN
jgi:ABC-type proline/glycine betaine transport system ATPase subunit